MRVSELDNRLSTLLDDATSQKNGPKQRVRALNDMQRSLVRMMAERDQNYITHRFTLSSSAARTVHGDEYAFRLPSWVLKVVGVRESTTTQGARLEYLPKAAKFGGSSGWNLTAQNEISFFRTGQPRSWIVECAKLPALMTRGTLPAQTAMATNQMRLDADPATTSDYPHETVQNAYSGALFEITGPVSARVGQLLRCATSVHDQSTAGTVLTMEEAWTTQPAVSDTYESHSEIQDQHINLLVLKAAQRLFAQAGNLTMLSAIAPELSEEYGAFVRSIESRDVQEPYFIQPSPFEERFTYQDLT